MVETNSLVKVEVEVLVVLIVTYDSDIIIIVLRWYDLLSSSCLHGFHTLLEIRHSPKMQKSYFEYYPQGL